MAFPLFLIKGASKLLKGVDSKDREALESTSDALNQDGETSSSVRDQVSIPVEEVVEYPGNVDPKSVESSDSLEGVPVFGSGIDMFLRLSDVALKSWYKAILWIRRGKRYKFGSSSSDVQMETDALNEGTPDVEVQSPFGDDLDVSIDAKESESETFGTWSLLGVAGMLISGMLLSKKFRTFKIPDAITSELGVDSGVMYGIELDDENQNGGDFLNWLVNPINILPAESDVRFGGSVYDTLGISGYAISSGFGRRVAPVSGASTYHNAVDIAVPVGTPVKAAFDGFVSDIFEDSKSGLVVRLRTDDGRYEATYAHLSKALVSVGDKVRRGDIVVESGSSGIGTGPHLHFGMAYIAKPLGMPVSRSDRQWFDPSLWREGMEYGSVVKDAPYVFPEMDVPELVTGREDAVALGARGLGLDIFNPFSIKYSASNDWEGQVGSARVGNGLEFARYRSLDEGIRAGLLLIQNYQTVKDVSGTGGSYITARDFVSNYVTSSDGNNTGAYLRNIESFTGYGPDEAIDLRDPETLVNFARGVSRQESGSRFSESYIDSVYRRYLHNRSGSGVNSSEGSYRDWNRNDF